MNTNDNSDEYRYDELYGGETFNIQEILRIIRAYKRSIAVIFIFVVLAAYYLSLTTRPVYKATTTAIIKQVNTNAAGLILNPVGATVSQRLKNEIAVLKSFSLHEEVVSDMIKTGAAYESALFGTRYIRKRYRAGSWFVDWIIGEPDSVLNPDSLSYKGIVRTVEKLRSSTNVNTLRETDVLVIEVNSTDSTDAIYLANLITTKYYNWDLAGGRGDIQFVLTFLDSQITKYEKRLVESEETLRNFQTEKQIYTLDGSTDLLLADLIKYESVYFTNIAELEVSQRRVEYLKSQLSDSEQALIEEIVSTNNPMIVALRERIAAMEAQKVQQMVDEGWTENSTQARDFQRRIEEMKARLTELTQNLILSGWSEQDPFAASQAIFNRIVEQEVEVHSSRIRAEEYRKLVVQMSSRLNELPTQILNYARLERERKLNENLYLTMKQKYENSRITEAGQRGKVRILDPAVIAVKVKPDKKKYMLLGIFFGLSLGFGLAFFREYLDNTVKAVEQLERKGLTVMGIVPDIHKDGGRRVSNQALKPSKGGHEFRRRLITYEDPKSPIAEAYRTLRTNISYSKAKHKIKSIIISSPQPGEGKSTTVANLAIAFAQLRKRTLLIDTDLRKPVQHNVFEYPRGPGITEYLVGDIEDFNSVVHHTKIENLYLVTAGNLPPNPSELLGSQKMSDLVEKLEHEWDMILFDSPPLVAVTDASMISAEIDSVLMVVKAAQTDRNAVDRALDTLKNVKAPLAGVVLNGVKPESLAGKYSYYYSYYQYYYADDGKKKKKGRKGK